MVNLGLLPSNPNYIMFVFQIIAKNVNKLVVFCPSMYFSVRGKERPFNSQKKRPLSGKSLDATSAAISSHLESQMQSQMKKQMIFSTSNNRKSFQQSYYHCFCC